MPLASFQMDVI